MQGDLELAPQRIGPYRILATLGRGGMGVVYRAQHRENGLHVALKTVRLARQELLQSLRREVHALAQLRHPGIVRVLDQGIEQGVPWYAMELLEGRSLRQVLDGLWRRPGPRGPGPLADRTAPDGTAASGGAPAWWTAALAGETQPWATEAGLAAAAAAGGPPDVASAAPGLTRAALAEGLGLLRRLCVTLGFLHGEGILHRDLKPENIVIREEKGTRNDRVGAGLALPFEGKASLAPTFAGLNPVLVDFGLAARILGAEGREVLDALDDGAGSFAYMAPEQIRGEPLDARTDLYALGCILYELLTGRMPFGGSNAASVRRGHLAEPPVPPSRLVPELAGELDALVLRLLSKRPQERLGHADTVAAALARLGATAAAGPELPRARAYLYRPRFVGRAHLMARLQRCLSELEAGRGALVLIEGESGAGKTRLAAELARRAALRRLRVLVGQCEALGGGDGSSRGTPLQGLLRPLQAVADRCREGGLEVTQRLLGARGRLLAPYEPVLLELPGQAAHPEPARLPAAAARERLFAALCETFEALAGEQPVLLVIDDLQWADDLTLGWLEHLLRRRRLDTEALFVLGTYRSDEASGRLRGLGGAAPGLGVRLERFSDEEVGDLALDMLGLEAAPVGFIGFLARQAAGNPFFVAEYLRTAVAEGVLGRDARGLWQVAVPPAAAGADEDPYARLPLPASLDALVGRRLDLLEPAARRLAEAAAVLGRDMPDELLRDVAGRAGIDEPEAAVELLARQVLEEAGPGELRFTHDRIRERCYELIARPRRAELHHAAAEGIDALDAPRREARLAELGFHREQAGQPEPARAAYLQAAGRARAVYANAEAERLYRAYLALVRDPTPESVQARNELANQVLQVQGRNREAAEQYELALAEASRSGDRALQSQILGSLAELYQLTDRMDAAAELLSRALELCNGLDLPRRKAALLNSLAMVHVDRGRFDEARHLYEQGLESARAAGDRRYEGVLLGNMAAIYHDRGHLAEARALHEQALALHRETGNRRFEGLALGNLGELAYLEGRLDEALELSRRGAKIHREVGARLFVGQALQYEALVHMARGEAELAATAIEESVRLYHEVDSRHFEAIALRDRARLHRLFGPPQDALAEAERLLDQAEALLREIGGGRMPLGFCLCERGHAALARAVGAQDRLAEVAAIVAEAQMTPSSMLGQDFDRLRRAQAAYEAGSPLCRGELLDGLPPGLQRRLGLP